MEDWWKTSYQWAMLLQQYLRSVEVRDETKFSLLLGLILGTVSVMIISIYPGKPIDYSGIGFDLPSELQGSDDAQPSRSPPQEEEPLTRKGESPSKEDETSLQRRIEETQSTLRRRRGKKVQENDGDLSERSGEVQASGQAAEGGGVEDLDEDELTRKFAEGKAVKMLGLTQDQVRQAVRDAKLEMLRDKARDGGIGDDHSLPRGSPMEQGMGLASSIFWVVALLSLIGLWFLLYTNPRDPLTRFLIRAFPREMKVLGLSSGLELGLGNQVLGRD